MPISPNDWNIKTFLVVCISIIIAAWLMVALHYLAIDILIIQQIIGFVFLTLLPGYIVLRIFKLHNINPIESLLYSVGISLVFIFVTGTVANFLLPGWGLQRPISIIPIMVCSTILIILLLLAACIIDGKYQMPNLRRDASLHFDLHKLTWSEINSYLIALLLPLLSILGILLINYYGNNTLIFILIFFICLIIILAALNKFPEKSYIFIIFFMSLSLLYQTSLISTNLVGSDVHLEYGIGNAVIEQGRWDYAKPSTVNSCLSVVFLAPIYSMILNMDIIWLIKIIYPILFSLLPIVLFRAYRIQTNPLIAFLSSIFFITMPMFFMDMPQLIRQQVSEIFFGLVILLMVERKLKPVSKTILSIIFGMGVIVSHYGLGTGYIGYVLCTFMILAIIKSKFGQTAWQFIITKKNALPEDLKHKGAFSVTAALIIICLSSVFMLFYYSAVASGTAMSGIDALVHTISNIINSIVDKFANLSASAIPAAPGDNLSQLQTVSSPPHLEPLAKTAIGLDILNASPLGMVWRVLQYIVEICLIAGLLLLIVKSGYLGKNVKSEFVALNVTSALILLSLFTPPTYSGSYGWGMGSVRIWHITLLIMSPLFISGGSYIAYFIKRSSALIHKKFKHLTTSFNINDFAKFPVIFILVPYFIFNSGAIFELTGSSKTSPIDIPYSIALSN